MKMCEHFVAFIQFPLVFYGTKIYGLGYKIIHAVDIFVVVAVVVFVFDVLLRSWGVIIFSVWCMRLLMNPFYLSLSLLLSSTPNDFSIFSATSNLIQLYIAQHTQYDDDEKQHSYLDITLNSYLLLEHQYQTTI